MLLRRHNLNLLPILRELLRTRSVTRTAQTVGLGQSAVSSALARLREDLNDDLLVSVGRRMELTERAKALIEPVELACIDIERVFASNQFAPERETRTFVIAAADYVSYLLAPPLTRAFAQEAPQASLQFVEYPADLARSLASGAVDGIVLPDDTLGDLARRFRHTPLFEDRLVVIASSREPPFPGELTRDVFAAMPHAMFKLAPRESTSHEAMLLRQQGIRPQMRVLVDQFLTLPAVVEGSSCIALLQSRLARAMQRSHDIAIHALPFDQPRLSLALVWNSARESDPAHRWLRRTITAASASLGPLAP